VPEAQLDEPVLDALAHDLDERCEDRGAGSPDDVEAGHRVAVPGCGVPAALSPADDREQLDALRREPRPLLAGGEGEVGLGPLPAPLVFVFAVELGAREPVLPGEIVRVLDAHATLLGSVDEEEPAERPPGLTAERRLRLLFEHDDPLAGFDEFGRRHQARQSRADHDHISLRRHP
jgi:hypothetical protein